MPDDENKIYKATPFVRNTSMSWVSIIIAVALGASASWAASEGGVVPTTPGQGVENTSISERDYHGEVPEYLFHWTSPESLTALAESGARNDLIPLKDISMSMFATVWGHFQGRKGLFTWTHPAGAISAGPERYARQGGDGKPPRLLVLKLNQNVRVVEVFTIQTASRGSGIASLALQGADLVFHHVLTSSGRPRFSEWIVLNSKAVAEFSAAPKSLPTHIREQLENARNAPDSLADIDLFYPRYPEVEYRLEMISKYLSGGADGIPSRFMHSLTANGERSLGECLNRAISIHIGY